MLPWYFIGAVSIASCVDGTLTGLDHGCDLGGTKCAMVALQTNQVALYKTIVATSETFPISQEAAREIVFDEIPAKSSPGATCVNTRDNRAANTCATQRANQVPCTKFLNWKDCDETCNLCACSTAAAGATKGEHCTNHGKCVANCTEDRCEKARCECSPGWTGFQCEIQLAGRMRGDPHAIYQGHQVTFKLPEARYVKLFEQDGFQVFGLGGKPSPEYDSQNFMYSLYIQRDGEEIIRVEQNKDPQFFASYISEENISGMLNVTVRGEPLQMLAPDAELASELVQISGHPDVHLVIERRKVLVHCEKLRMSIRSEESRRQKNIPNHLDFSVSAGLDSENASGVLPQLWGLQPMSVEVKDMLKQPEQSFLRLLENSASD